MLLKSAKGLSETEIDDKLNNAIRLFDYLEDKDMFQTVSQFCYTVWCISMSLNFSLNCCIADKYFRLSIYFRFIELSRGQQRELNIIVNIEVINDN